MSYVSGFMLGASIGKAIHGMFAKNDMAAGVYQTAPMPAAVPAAPKTAPVAVSEAELPVFSCVSAVKGRRRYRAAAIVGNQPLADMLEESLSKLHAVQTVQINVVTGSILLCADDEGILDRIEIFLRNRVFTEKTAAKTAVLQSSTHKAAYSDVLYDTLDLFNGIIAKKTANVLDLRSLVSFIFIIRGMRKMIVLNQRPSGPQMLWWAASLMRGRR